MVNRLLPKLPGTLLDDSFEPINFELPANQPPSGGAAPAERKKVRVPINAHWIQDDTGQWLVDTSRPYDYKEMYEDEAADFYQDRSKPVEFDPKRPNPIGYALGQLPESVQGPAAFAALPKGILELGLKASQDKLEQQAPILGKATDEITDELGWEYGPLSLLARNVGHLYTAPAALAEGAWHALKSGLDTYDRYSKGVPVNKRSLDQAAFDTSSIAPLGVGAAKATSGALGRVSDTGDLGVFAGRRAAANFQKAGRPAPQMALDLADALERSGFSPDEIALAATDALRAMAPEFGGVSKAADGKWRFEIDDSQSRLNPDYDFAGGSPALFREVLDHPDLFTAYPELGSAPTSASFADDVSGMFTPYRDPLTGERGIAGVTANAPSESTARSVLLHEGQHGAQLMEDFAPGSTPLSFFDNPELQDRFLSPAVNAAARREFGVPTRHGLPRSMQKEMANSVARQLYENTAGEVESRNVQARADMTPEERGYTPPQLTEDRTRNQQLVFGYDDLFGSSLDQGMLAGPKAKTADLEALGRAEQMETQGVSPDVIWKTTGWGRAADGKWRFEIDDSGATFNPSYDIMSGRPSRLPDVFDHPALYEAYPELRKSYASAKPGDEIWGEFDPRAATDPATGEQLPLFEAAGRDVDETRRAFLHELQHGVQTSEGFASGGNATQFRLPGPQARLLSPEIERVSQKRYGVPARKLSAKQYRDLSDEVANQLYEREAGEVEARNVETRANMTPEERLASRPIETEDTPRGSQVMFEPGDRPWDMPSNIMAGRNARTADLEALRRAEELEKQGADRDAVWDETGWFRGADGEWRFEIDDSGLSFKDFPGGSAQFGGGWFGRNKSDVQKGRLGDMVDHPDLFAAYPELTDRSLSLRRGWGEEAGGAQSPWTGSIDVRGYNTPDMRGSLVHELQHGVQGIEGFASGSNPNREWRPWRRGEDAHYAYEATKGEVEARNARDRYENKPYKGYESNPNMPYVPDEYYKSGPKKGQVKRDNSSKGRRPTEYPPYQTEDVAREHQTDASGLGWALLRPDIAIPLGVMTDGIGRGLGFWEDAGRSGNRLLPRFSDLRDQAYAKGLEWFAPKDSYPTISGSVEGHVPFRFADDAVEVSPFGPDQSIVSPEWQQNAVGGRVSDPDAIMHTGGDRTDIFGRDPEHEAFMAQMARDDGQAYLGRPENDTGTYWKDNLEYYDNNNPPIDNPYEQARVSKAWRDKVKRTGELFANNEEAGIVAAGMAAGRREIDSRGFYSPSLEAAKGLKQQSGTVQQFKSQILKGGGKPKELEAVGFDKAFPDPNAKVTRQEIEDFLRANRVELGETRYGEYQKQPDGQIPPQVLSDLRELDNLGFNSPREAFRAIRSEADWARNWDVDPSRGGADQRLYEWMQENPAYGEAQGPSRYESYSTPGGIPGSYREVVTTIPSEYRRQLDEAQAARHAIMDRYPRSREGVEQYLADPEYQEASRRAAHFEEMESNARGEYTSSHWPGVTNPLNHRRIKHFENDDVVHLEDGTEARGITQLEDEIQADNAEAARKYGTKDPAEAVRLTRENNEAVAAEDAANQEGIAMLVQLRDSHPEISELIDKRVAASGLNSVVELTPRRTQAILHEIYANGMLPGGRGSPNEAAFIAGNKIAREVDRVMDLQNKIAASTKGVPKLPFMGSTSDWVDLSHKQGLIDAARNPRVTKYAFTPGDVQAQRYNMANTISGVRYNPDTHGLQVRYPHDGAGKWYQLPGEEGGLSPQELPNAIGRELADRLLAQPRTGDYGGFHTIDDLGSVQVGGEGHKKFYGTMSPEGYQSGIVGTRLSKLVKGLDPEAAKIDAVDVGPRQGRVVQEGDDWYVDRGNGERSPPLSTRTQAELWAKNNAGGGQRRNYPSISITPALRKKILDEGLSLFANKEDLALITGIVNAAESEGGGGSGVLGTRLYRGDYRADRMGDWRIVDEWMDQSHVAEGYQGIRLSPEMQESIRRYGFSLFANPEEIAIVSAAMAMAEGGEPIRAYHWSPVPEEITPQSRFYPFSHFGLDPRQAEGRLNDQKKSGRLPWSPEGETYGGTFPVDMDISNPLRLDADSGTHDPLTLARDVERKLGLPTGQLSKVVIDQWLKDAQDGDIHQINSNYYGFFDGEIDQFWLKFEEKILRDIETGNKVELDQLIAGLKDMMEDPEGPMPYPAAAYEVIGKALEDAGHDGIVYPNQFEGDKSTDSYIATKPETIRSATTGETLFSNDERALPGVVVSGADEAPQGWDRVDTSTGDVQYTQPSLPFGKPGSDRGVFTDDPMTNAFPGHERPVFDPESANAANPGMVWPFDITERDIQRSGDVRGFPDLWANPAEMTLPAFAAAINQLIDGDFAPEENFGSRQDGTPKGMGFMGPLQRPDGRVSTELSIGVDLGQGETEIPLLVPTLSQQEVDWLLSQETLDPRAVPQEIVDKAIEHAVRRMQQGQSPFAD